MKYFIEDTTLTNIADAVREKEESTQPIPVVELAGRIRDIQTGSTVGKQLNDDGTQNVFVDDTKGDTIDTGKPIASVKYNGVEMDLVGGSGEIPITANGTYDVKKYASASVNVQSAPVLLWTNASPTSNFSAQTVNLSGAAYSGYIVECKDFTKQTYMDSSIGFAYLRMGKVGICVSRVGGSDYGRARPVSSVTTSGITFGNGYSGGGVYPDAQYCIPLRIWGVKFTL